MYAKLLAGICMHIYFFVYSTPETKKRETILVISFGEQN
jgi:hypothetical protein